MYLPYNTPIMEKTITDLIIKLAAYDYSNTHALWASGAFVYPRPTSGSARAKGALV